MNDEFDPDDDELELDAADAERLFEEHGEQLRKQLGAEVDLERLEELTKHAVASHPDRENIIELMKLGTHFFVKPAGEGEFELNLGYFDDPRLNPPGAVPGKYVTLGRLALADVQRRPQG